MVNGTAVGIKKIEREHHFFLSQLYESAIVGISAVGVWLIVQFFPTFFVYPYFLWGGWENVWRFWPLFLWGFSASVALFLLSENEPIKKYERRILLRWKITTSTFAGIWEEIGYRCVYICFAMIVISFMNWLFSTGLGWIVAVVLFIGAFMLYKDDNILFSIPMAILSLLAALFGLYANPVHWLLHILVWVANLTTLTMMEDVLYHGRESLFIFGALVANAWFRDGHKYQGLFGVVNSWYGGMVLFYATVTYGLFTAIVVHIIYNVIITILRFVLQKTE